MYDMLNPYSSFHISIGSFSYSYIPPVETICSTIRKGNIITTTCPGSRTTIDLNPISGVNSGDILRTLTNNLNLMENMINKTEILVQQCVKNLDIKNNIKMGETSYDVETKKISYDVETKEYDIKCRCCGSIWQKEYLVINKYYFCQMCSAQHIFSPYRFEDFIPFENDEDAQKFHDTMITENLKMYNGHKGFWIN